MDLVAFLAVLALLAAAVWFISAPLRAEPDEATRVDGGRAAEIERLEAARDAKYREIRDAEMDLRTGKLSQRDHGALNAALRAEAVAILRELDAARAAQGSDQTTS